eukprot:736236_1
MEQSLPPTLSNYSNTINLWATCQWYNNYAGKEMKILNQRLQITDKSINSSIRQFIIENTKTFQKYNNIHIDVDRMMKEHYQAYNSVKDKNYIIYIGFLNVKFEEDVNIIDTINTHRLCDNLREYGIKQGGIKSIIG